MLAATRRLIVFLIASLPAYPIVAVVMWPHAGNDLLPSWFISGTATTIAVATGLAVQWRKLPKMAAKQLRLMLVWTFAVPIGAQWGVVGLVVRPTDADAALTLAMLVLITSVAAFAVGGAASKLVGSLVVTSIVIPNYLVFAIDHGAYSVPAMLTLYGALITTAVGVLAQYELGKRADLIAQSEELLEQVAHERSNLTELNEELEFRATHDMLMGIPNRDLLQIELQAALADRRREGEHVGLLFLDLDRFKFVNDTMGHAAGDELLKSVADRIERSLTTEDAVVARVGGDELVVLIRTLHSEEHLEIAAGRILVDFRRPFTIEDQELAVGVSIGMAMSTGDETADDLYRHADAALYEAKESGRGRAVLADRSLREQRESRIRTERALRGALVDRQIEAWFQPEVDLVSGRVIAAEALARWRTGDGVEIASSFIDVAGRAGMLERLMLEMADQIWRWRKQTGVSIPIGLNVSAPHIPTLLARHNLDPAGRPFEGLRLEIAETDIIRDFDRARLVLERVRELGGSIMLDDFGAGFSSLRMLSDLPIDGIKIDRSYVARVETDVRVRHLVTSLAEFGRSSDVLVIAEGVETPKQAEFLTQVGIDRAQGFLYSKAVDAPEFTDLVALGYTGTQLAGRF